MNPSGQFLEDESQETLFPGDDEAGYMQKLGDPRIVNFPYKQSSKDPRFNENLAFHLDEGELNKIGNYLTEAIKTDDDGRQKWLRTIRDGIDYFGIGNDRYKTNNYSKNTDIYAPTLNKIISYNAAKLHSNLFPSENFVQSKTRGQVNPQIEDQAYRMKEFSNYMLEDVMIDYFDDKEQAFYWMVAAGNVFSKPYLDATRNHPKCPYIRPEDIIINSGASSIADAERVTHRFTLSKRLYEEKFNSGQWRRVYVDDYDLQQDIVRQKTESKIGIETQVDDVNKIGCFDECMCYLDLNGFSHVDENGEPSGRYLPYIVTKDKSNNNIVDIRRNWDENDPLFRPIQRIIQWKYAPGWGPYGLGLIHLTLGMAKCQTDLLQQLILAAKLCNSPSLLQNTTLKNERSQINIAPGVINQVSTFDNNIQNAFMPMPFNPPQAIMMDLVNFIGDAMNDQSAATDFDPQQIPANTGELLTSAIISTSHILENSVMKRMYRSFSSELKLLYNIFAEWLPASPYPFDVPGGNSVIMREDFTPNVRIIPSIDPNCSSSLHQLITAESLLKLAGVNPELYNVREIHKRILSSLKITDPDNILLPNPDDETIPELDFISENARALRGESIKVYATQDHAGHIVGHQDMINQLMNDQSDDNTDKITALKAHVNDHKAYEYLAQMQAMIGQMLPENMEQVPENIQNEISMKAAQAIQLKQQQEEAKNPPPIDPNKVMMEELNVKKQELQVKSQQIQSTLEIDHLKIERENQKDNLNQQIQIKDLEIKEQQLQIEKLKLTIQEEEIRLKSQIEMAKLQQARRKADLDIQSKTFDSTMRYESEKERDAAKLQEESRKTDMESQGRAFDSALKYEQQQHLDKEITGEKVNKGE